MDAADTLNIVEITFENSPSMQFRFAAYPAPDATHWIRHGIFRQFYADGSLASEGSYANDLEDGSWRDYHTNGRLAAEGSYSTGNKTGEWRYYDDNGALSEVETFPVAT